MMMMMIQNWKLQIWICF